MAASDFSILNSTWSGNSKGDVLLVQSNSLAFNLIGSNVNSAQNIVIGYNALQTNFPSVINTLQYSIFLGGNVSTAPVSNSILNSIAIGINAFIEDSNECILGGSLMKVAINKLNPKYALHIGSDISPNALQGFLCMDSCVTDPVISSIPTNSGIFYVKNGIPLYANTANTFTGYISTVIASGSVTLSAGTAVVTNANITATCFININCGSDNTNGYRVTNQQNGSFSIVSTDLTDTKTITWKAST